MKKPTKHDCSGCRDDFYNCTSMGANETSDGPTCWSLERAQFVKLRLISINMPGPQSNWDKVKPVTKPSCYRQQGFVSQKVESKKS